MKPSYIELLKDPRWQRKRLEIFNRDKFTCQECKAADKTLNVHHTMYEHGRSPWEYDSDTLETLCEDCHKDITQILRRIRSGCGLLSKTGARLVLGYLAGAILGRSGGKYKPDHIVEFSGLAAYHRIGLEQLKEIIDADGAVSFDDVYRVREKAKQ